MKIVVLTGSPHKEGTTSVLVNQFVAGAQEAGHEVYQFDAAFKKVHPCIGCAVCNGGEKDCVFKDDMNIIAPKLIGADLIVFASPLYYYSATAQLLAVVSRFYGIDCKLKGAHKKAVLLVTGTNTAEWAMKGIVVSYQEALQYLEWHDCGTVLAKGCPTKEAIEQTDFPEQAYRLGKEWVNF